MKTSLWTLLLLGACVSTTTAQNRGRTEPAPLPSDLRSIDTGLSIRGMYGFGRMIHNDVVGAFADHRIIEGHLAFRNTQWVYTADSTIIPGLRLSSLFYGSRTTPSDGDGISSESSRFGARSAGGYGWANQAGMILPYSSSSIVWTKLDLDPLLLDSADRGIFADFDDATRFGTAIEAGVEVISSNGFSAGLGVERNMVFPRHLVFKEIVASIIQSGLAELAGSVIVKFSNSRIAGPLAAFIVSNGIRFAISELRRKEMNWPFTSSPPLVFDSFTIGVAYTF